MGAVGLRSALVVLAIVGGCTGSIRERDRERSQGPGGGDDAGEGAASGRGGAGAGGSAGEDGAGDGDGDGDDPSVEACLQPELGATPLQRISRAHYANSVRDLLKVAFDPSQLPEDEKYGPFDGNVVVPVTDLLVEQYVAAAESAARLALPQIESLVPCDREALGDAACAARLIETFGKRVYRRPLTSDEVERYEALFSTFAGRGYPDALRIVVQTMLQSPSFLYRVELMPADASAGGSIQPLDAYELAARLSFFVLGTTPDDALLAEADSDALLEPDVLMQETDRLLDDARFTDTLASFHLQWLELEKLDGLSRDAELFPAFTPELGAAMREETLRFIEHVMRQDDATLHTLLTAPYSFPEGPLLAVYDLAEDEVDADGPTTLEHRAGLLTQPAFLAAHAHYDQSSPVQRGKVIIRNVLCQVLPDPPPNVNATPPDPSPDATTRERLAQHQNDNSCRSCHKRIDGIGLGLEHFDAVGAYRATESGKAIDASGTILGTVANDGDFDGALELAERLAGSEDVQRCLTTQWVRFALGRPESTADACAIDGVYQDFAAAGGDIRVLLRAIVASDAFRSKLIPEATP